GDSPRRLPACSVASTILRMANQLQHSFDAGAGTYDRARRKLIPCFDEFYRAAIEQIPFEREQEFELLDLGAGTGMLSALIANAFPGARFKLVDISNEMLVKARERFALGGSRFHFEISDFSEKPIKGQYDAIVSGLSIHHLTTQSKRALIKNIHAALKPGGVFVNADQVCGETPAIERRNHEAWLRRTRELGVSEPDLRVALERMKLDRPVTVDDQLGWLREAGFREVCLVYRNLIFAVYSGRK
ncbi:MAG TPA: methyltransferase domain-containing protein, partial [Candidatus Binataceae bacterium]